jgi:hypothetical protein
VASFGETYFGRIGGPDQAVVVLRGCALATVLLALVYAIDPARFLVALGGGVFELEIALVVDATLLVFAAAMAFTRRSRAFAALVAGWVLLNTIGTVLLRLSHVPFGNNVFLAVLGIYIATRMVLASVRYHRFKGTRLNGGVAVAKNLVGCVVSVAACLALNVGVGDAIDPSVLGSLTILVAALGYSLPFARAFPVLGARALTRSEPGAAPARR